uniref:Uncharacterized protein n=1 Tax=Candidatus Kentrum sp. FW TaxID=2126338 RepID=A0A450T164_9GAMM|nr:MAG: hypothetical protein BECKFW1821A_GA0114235_10998 [Candidatus Kentron sp. FW]
METGQRTGLLQVISLARPCLRPLIHDQSVTRKIFDKMIKKDYTNPLSPVGNTLRGVPKDYNNPRNALVRVPYNQLRE